MEPGLQPVIPTGNKYTMFLNDVHSGFLYHPELSNGNGTDLYRLVKETRAAQRSYKTQCRDNKEPFLFFLLKENKGSTDALAGESYVYVALVLLHCSRVVRLIMVQNAQPI